MHTIYQVQVDDSTLADVRPEAANLARRALSLAVLLALAGYLAFTAAGTFERTGQATLHSGPLTARIEYPRVSRAGHEAAVRIRLHSREPLPQKLSLTVSGSYLELFEDAQVSPEPGSQAAEGGQVVHELAVEPGRTAVITLSGRVSDDWQWRNDAVLRLQAGAQRLELDISTWRIP